MDYISALTYYLLLLLIAVVRVVCSLVTDNTGKLFVY